MADHSLSADTRALMAFEAKKKSMALSYVLWFFLGAVGGHRYYNGRVGTGLAILALDILGWLTFVFWIGFIFLFAAGVWLIVDLFLIPGWVSRYNSELMMRLDGGASPTLVAAS